MSGCGAINPPGKNGTGPSLDAGMLPAQTRPDRMKNYKVCDRYRALPEDLRIACRYPHIE